MIGQILAGGLQVNAGIEMRESQRLGKKQPRSDVGSGE
jgi:hypothetical protein